MSSYDYWGPILGPVGSTSPKPKRLGLFDDLLEDQPSIETALTAPKKTPSSIEEALSAAYDYGRPLATHLGEVVDVPFKIAGALGTAVQEYAADVPPEDSRITLNRDSLLGFDAPPVTSLAIEETIKRPAEAAARGGRVLPMGLGVLPAAAARALGQDELADSLMGGTRELTDFTSPYQAAVPKPLQQAESVAEPVAELAAALPLFGGAFGALGGVSPNAARLAGLAFAPEMVAGGAESLGQAQAARDAGKDWTDPETLRAGLGGLSSLALGGVGLVHGLAPRVPKAAKTSKPLDIEDAIAQQAVAKEQPLVDPSYAREPEFTPTEQVTDAPVDIPDAPLGYGRGGIPAGQPLSIEDALQQSLMYPPRSPRLAPTLPRLEDIPPLQEARKAPKQPEAVETQNASRVEDAPVQEAEIAPEGSQAPADAVFAEPSPQTPAPRWSYRARDVGEEGIPSASHSQASLSEADARRLAPSRSEGPQEIVRVDLSRLKEGDEYEVRPGPTGSDWVKYNRPLTEAELERVGEVTQLDREAASKAEPPLREAVEAAPADHLSRLTGLDEQAVEKGRQDVRDDGVKEFSPEAVAVKRAVLAEGVGKEPAASDRGPLYDADVRLVDEAGRGDGRVRQSVLTPEARATAESLAASLRDGDRLIDANGDVRTIRGGLILDEAGNVIGRFRKLTRGPDGKPVSGEILLDNDTTNVIARSRIERGGVQEKAPSTESGQTPTLNIRTDDAASYRVEGDSIIVERRSDGRYIARLQIPGEAEGRVIAEGRTVSWGSEAEALAAAVRRRPRLKAEISGEAFRVPESGTNVPKESTPVVKKPSTTAPVLKEQAQTLNKQPWEMTGDELDAAHASAKEREAGLDRQILGADYDRYNQAQRVANSTFASKEKQDAADAVIREIEARLSPEARNQLFGIGENTVTADTYRAYRDKIRRLDPSSPEELGASLRWAMTEVGRKSDPRQMTEKEAIAYAQIREAYRIAVEQGWNPADVGRAALRGAAERFSDPDDAAFMLSHYFAGKEPPAPQPKQIEARRPIRPIPPEKLAQGPPRTFTIKPVGSTSKYGVYEGDRRLSVHDSPTEAMKAQERYQAGAVPPKREMPPRPGTFPKDETGQGIYPGEEHLTPEQRRLLTETAKARVMQLAQEERAEPTGRRAIYGGQTGNEVIGGITSKSKKIGTPLEDVAEGTARMQEAVEKDRGNVLERQIRQELLQKDADLREAMDDTWNDAVPKFAVRPSPGQRGLEGIAEDVPSKESVKKRGPEQEDLFGKGAMLQGTESFYSKGKEASGPLFTQERDAAVKADKGRQQTLESPRDPMQAEMEQRGRVGRLRKLAEDSGVLSAEQRQRQRIPERTNALLSEIEAAWPELPADLRARLEGLMPLPRTLRAMAEEKFAPSPPAEAKSAVGATRLEKAEREGTAKFATTAYHGSPHDFDKFDSSKIGTGEGAQAYGHGLYFAGKREVAEFYKQRLTEGRNLDPEFWKKQNLPPGLSTAEFGRLSDLGLQMSKAGNLPAAEMSEWRGLKDRQRAYEDAVEAARPKGRTYEVELAPDEADFLDWDKPLSQQSEKVRAALEPYRRSWLNKDPSGREMYTVLASIKGSEQAFGKDATRWTANVPSDVAASAALREAGIPGLRYLDGSSRGSGEGSHNYVIFDDSLIAVKNKYALGKSGERSALRSSGDADLPGVARSPRVSGPQPGGPATESRPQPVKSQATQADSRALRSRIEQTFKPLRVQQTKDGYVMPTPSGKRIIVKPEGEIVFPAEMLEAGYGPKAAQAYREGKLQIAGVTYTAGRDVIIRIADGLELPHEGMHAFLENFASPSERLLIRKKFEAQAKADGKAWDETAADTYRKWRDKPESQTPMGKFFTRVRDFFLKLKDALFPSAEGVFRAVKSGEPFTRTDVVQSGAAKFATAPKQPPLVTLPFKPKPKAVSEVDRLGKRAAETAKEADSIASRFEALNEKFRIGQKGADRVEQRGTIEKSDRPAFREAGQPDAQDTKSFRFSSEDIQRSGRQMVDAVKSFREAELEFRKNADPNSAEAMKFARQTMERAIKQWQVYRSAAGRAVKTFDRPIPADVIQSLREAGNLARVKEIKERVPLLTNIVNGLKRWSELTDAEKKQVGSDVLDHFRLNLFSVTSFTLDMVGNGTELAGQTAGGLARDLVRVSRGDVSFPSMQGMLRAIRHADPRQDATTGIPSEIANAFRRTVSGEPLKQRGGTFTYGDTKLSKAYDWMVGLPLYLKGGVDTSAKRFGAMATLYRDALEIAHKRGMTGLAKQELVNHLVNHPTEEMAARAIANGQKSGFDRVLTNTEEKIAGSTWTKLLVSGFARWPFQFTRWAGEMLGANPEMLGKIKRGQATREEVAHYLAKTATGWGGLYMLSQNVYDRVDFNSMEYVDEDGNRVRLSNRDPIPSALWLLAVIKGDAAKAAKGLQYASLPGAALLSGEGGGLLTGIVQGARRAVENTQSDPRALRRELDDTINRAIPGQAVLSLIETLIDPKIREGIGANLPGVSLTKDTAIDPVTGKDLEPRQKIAGMELPSIGGTPIPGATRLLDPVQKLLSRYGLLVYRGPRSPIAGYPPGEVPEDMRREWQEAFGGYRQKLLAPVASAMSSLEGKDPERVRKLIQQRDTAAAKYADAYMARKYGGKRKLPRQPTMRELARPTIYQETSD